MPKKNLKLLNGFTPRAVDLMMRHERLGNVRKLENVVERAVIMARGEMITPLDFPQILKELDDELKSTSLNLGPGRSLKEVEKEMILRTLEETVGNRTHAARKREVRHSLINASAQIWRTNRKDNLTDPNEISPRQAAE